MKQRVVCQNSVDAFSLRFEGECLLKERVKADVAATAAAVAAATTLQLLTSSCAANLPTTDTLGYAVTHLDRSVSWPFYQ